MELWIRSQDKERLIKVENLFAEYNGDVDPELCPYSIVTDKCVELGIYKNYERALEVLDEIKLGIICTGLPYEETKEEIANSKIKVKGNLLFNTKTNTCLYEMPEE